MDSPPPPLELRRLRQLANRSQGDCAALLGFTRQAYADRERGRVDLRPTEWAKLRPFLLSIEGASVPEEMRRLRSLHDLSQTACGEVLSISREAYRLREEGRVPITGPELALLARHLYRMRIREAFPSYQPTEAESIFLEEMLAAPPSADHSGKNQAEAMR